MSDETEETIQNVPEDSEDDIHRPVERVAPPPQPVEAVAPPPQPVEAVVTQQEPVEAVVTIPKPVEAVVTIPKSVEAVVTIPKPVEAVVTIREPVGVPPAIAPPPPVPRRTTRATLPTLAEPPSVSGPILTEKSESSESLGTIDSNRSLDSIDTIDSKIRSEIDAEERIALHKQVLSEQKDDTSQIDDGPTQPLIDEKEKKTTGIRFHRFETDEHKLFKIRTEKGTTAWQLMETLYEKGLTKYMNIQTDVPHLMGIDEHWLKYDAVRTMEEEDDMYVNVKNAKKHIRRRKRRIRYVGRLYVMKFRFYKVPLQIFAPFYVLPETTKVVNMDGLKRYIQREVFYGRCPTTMVEVFYKLGKKKYKRGFIFLREGKVYIIERTMKELVSTLLSYAGRIKMPNRIFYSKPLEPEDLTGVIYIADLADYYLYTSEKTEIKEVNVLNLTFSKAVLLRPNKGRVTPNKLLRFVPCNPKYRSVFFLVMRLAKYGKQLRENYKAYKNRTGDDSSDTYKSVNVETDTNYFHEVTFQTQAVNPQRDTSHLCEVTFKTSDQEVPEALHRRSFEHLRTGYKPSPERLAKDEAERKALKKDRREHMTTLEKMSEKMGKLMGKPSKTLEDERIYRNRKRAVDASIKYKKETEEALAKMALEEKNRPKLHTYQFPAVESSVLSERSSISYTAPSSGYVVSERPSKRYDLPSTSYTGPYSSHAAIEQMPSTIRDVAREEMPSSGNDEEVKKALSVLGPVPTKLPYTLSDAPTELPSAFSPVSTDLPSTFSSMTIEEIPSTLSPMTMEEIPSTLSPMTMEEMPSTSMSIEKSEIALLPEKKVVITKKEEEKQEKKTLFSLWKGKGKGKGKGKEKGKEKKKEDPQPSC